MQSLYKAGNVRSKAKPFTRRISSSKRQAKTSSGWDGGYNFLKYSFKPLLDSRFNLEYRAKQTEREFYNSLKNLCQLYNIPLPNNTAAPYPHNVHISLKQIKEELHKRHPELKLFLIENDKKKCCLSTIKTYDTGPMLYYIPFKPVYRLLQTKETRDTGNLLLSAYTWLYKVVDIPSYIDIDSYLYYMYEIVDNNLMDVEDDYNRKEFLENKSEINAAKHYGEIINRSISNHYHIEQFENRLNRFCPTNDFETELLSLMKEAWDLYSKYPNQKIGLNCYNPFEEEDMVYEDKPIEHQQYISFIWDSSGWLFNQVQEFVNYDFQECPGVLNPITIQYFDTPQLIECHDLDFEIATFAFLDELAFVLHKYKIA